MLIINFQSIKNKVPDLSILIETSQPDIIIGTETWTNKDMLSSEFFPDNYTVYRRDRGTDNHGGVLVAVINTLTSTEAHVSKTAELLGVKIDLPNKRSLLVSSFYRPPKSGDALITDYLSDIKDLRDQHKNAIFYIGGDFNLPDIQWPEGIITGNAYPHKLSEDIIGGSEDLGLDQMVQCQTRGDNTLDLLFTTHPSLVEKIKPLPPLGRSDHDTEKPVYNGHSRD